MVSFHLSQTNFQNPNHVGPEYSCIQQCKKIMDPIPEKDITFLQSTSDAILQRISDIRKGSLNTRNPNSIPSNQPSNCYPKLDWDKHYTQSYLDQGHLKHQLKGRPSNVPQDPDLLQTEPIELNDSQNYKQHPKHFSSHRNIRKSRFIGAHKFSKYSIQNHFAR